VYLDPGLWQRLATEAMADQIALFVASLPEGDLPEDARDLEDLAAWLAADLGDQAADRGLDPAEVAAALGEAEWREAGEAFGFAPVIMRGRVA